MESLMGKFKFKPQKLSHTQMFDSALMGIFA